MKIDGVRGEFLTESERKKNRDESDRLVNRLYF